MLSTFKKKLPEQKMIPSKLNQINYQNQSKSHFFKSKVQISKAFQFFLNFIDSERAMLDC